MFVDIVPNRSSPPSILLRESYRDSDGRSKKRTLANLSFLSLEQAHKFKAILKGADIAEDNLEDAFDIIQTIPHGHVAAVLGSIDQLLLPGRLAKSDSESRRNALALIAGRILCPGSKLALSRELQGNASSLGRQLSLAPDLNENDLYQSMRWLLKRQSDIEKRLAKAHLKDSTVVLYDMSATYYEGEHCVLAQFGNVKKGDKKGKRQINFGIIATAEGCPIAIQVYPGNTADANTISDQIKKVRKDFAITKAVIVGDRGMLTNAQLDEACTDKNLADFGWISALRAPQIKVLVERGDIEPELFDQYALAEIQSEAYPGQRLIVCRNPHLGVKRRQKRLELLEATEKVLAKIQAACTRQRNPYRGKDRIAARVEREAAKYKVLKHFKPTITETGLSFERDQTKIEAEECLDGFYVVRARNVSQ